MLKKIQEQNYFILALYHTYMHEITKTPTRNPSEVSEQNYMVYLSIMIIIFFRKEMGFIGRKKRNILEKSWAVYSQNCREGKESQRMAVTANFGNPSEYEKSQLSWAHGITSVTGLRL